MGVVEIYVFQLLMDVGVNAISVYNYKMTSHVIAVCCVIYCFDFHNKNSKDDLNFSIFFNFLTSNTKMKNNVT